MKEDYLWDKTGVADPEIEMLENALQAFRYKEIAPPALPALEVTPFKKEAPRRRKLQFAFAMAACLAFGILALGVWFQVLRNNMTADDGSGARLAEANKPQTDAKQPEIKPPADSATADKTSESPVDRGENAKQSPGRNFVKIRKTLPAPARRKETKAPTVKATKPAVELTEEEQYAYDQLMTALSITSSKLKLVKEKVEGTDE